MEYFTFNVIKDNYFDFCPKKAHDTDTGYDCRAYIMENNNKPGEVEITPLSNAKYVCGNDYENGRYIYQVLKSNNHIKIPLGFSITVNQEKELKLIDSSENNAFAKTISYKIAFNLRMRSGLAFNKGIQCHFGTIDTAFGCMIYAMVYNISNKPFIVKHGDKICQLCVELNPILKNDVKIFEKITDLDMGLRKGFGSTGT